MTPALLTHAPIDNRHLLDEAKSPDPPEGTVGTPPKPAFIAIRPDAESADAQELESISINITNDIKVGRCEKKLERARRIGWSGYDPGTVRWGSALILSVTCESMRIRQRRDRDPCLKTLTRPFVGSRISPVVSETRRCQVENIDDDRRPHHAE